MDVSKFEQEKESGGSVVDDGQSCTTKTSGNNTNDSCTVLYPRGRRQQQPWEALFEPQYTFVFPDGYTDPIDKREAGLEKQASRMIQQHTRQASSLQGNSSMATLPAVQEDDVKKTKSMKKEKAAKSSVSSPRPRTSETSHDSAVLDRDKNDKTDVNDQEDDANEDESVISDAPSPTLPRMEHLMLHTHPAMDQPEQIAILPCPSQSLSLLQHAHTRNMDKVDKWKDRLQLLNSIHQGSVPGRQESKVDAIASQHHYRRSRKSQSDTNSVNTSRSSSSSSSILVAMETPAEMTMMMAPTPTITTDVNDNDNRSSAATPWWRSRSWLLDQMSHRRAHIMQQCRRPYDAVCQKIKQVKRESQLPFFTTQLLVMQEQEKKQQLVEQQQAVDVEKDAQETEMDKKRRDPVKYRPSFLYFVFGFLFPPVWIMGALYRTKAEEDMAKADFLWKRRSRNAFLLFLVFLFILILCILILKPEALGWRFSTHNPGGQGGK
ncbi:hypothetical protein BC940DRAFT_344288 [Gongronella butleri]|nr:hypothetical protein BC940DRAFT_344288 [Gongronella butleri]